MKYKNIYSAIHNFGHSFTSLMNYVEGGYVIDELLKIHEAGYDIEIDWLSGKFEPAQRVSKRVKQSISYYRARLKNHFRSENVEIERIRSLCLQWPAGGRRLMLAIDDRGKEYKIYVSEAQ